MGQLARIWSLSCRQPTALQAALPLGVGGTNGSPFEVQVLLPSVTNGSQVVAASSQAATPSTPVLVSMFYDKAAAAQPQLKPNQSQLLQYLPTTGRWQIIAPSGQSAALSWVASQPLSETGILAVGRMISPDFGLKPEMYAVASKSPNRSPIRVQIVMPAASTILTKSAFVRSAVPLEIDQVSQLQCNFGNCAYDPPTRQVLWQGAVDNQDLLVLSFELNLDSTIPPGHLPKTITLTATAFDGLVEHALSASVSVRGSLGEAVTTKLTDEILPNRDLQESLR
jgi:hypothetical protein